MTLSVLVSLISAFSEARCDESAMISFGPYSPECVEGEFSELYIQDTAYNIVSKPQSSLLGASAPGEGFLQLVALYRYARL